MKCAYEATHSVEGHMVANMLEQHGIDARVAGEHLSSGVGELPATGLVRVMVDAADEARALEIIREWEAMSSPASDLTISKRSFAPAWFALGLVAGAAIMSWIDHL
jgi:hypothetical protein